MRIMAVTVTTRTTWYLLHGVFLWCGAFGLWDYPKLLALPLAASGIVYLRALRYVGVSLPPHSRISIHILGCALRVALVLCPCEAVML
jgi:hypothetical protein